MFRYWLARVLGILLVILVGVFSFDSNGIGVLIQLVPAIILAGALVLSWKLPLHGGIAYIIIGIGFTLFFHTYQSWVSFMILSVPLFLAGELFLWEGMEQKQKKL